MWMEGRTGSERQVRLKASGDEKMVDRRDIQRWKFTQQAQSANEQFWTTQPLSNPQMQDCVVVISHEHSLARDAQLWT